MARANRQRGGNEVHDVHKYDRIPISMENIQELADAKTLTRHEVNMIVPNTLIASKQHVKPGMPVIQPRNCWLCEGW